MHEHIQTIQDRLYAETSSSGHFVPTTLGLALVQGFTGYARDWLDLAKVMREGSQTWRPHSLSM